MKYIAIISLLFIFGCGSQPPSWKDELITQWASENISGGVSFVGDSITEQWPSEYMPCGAINRGISGNTTFDILDRTWLIVDEQPDELYIMIGANNLLQGYPVSSIVTGIEGIINQVQDGSPHTEIYIMSILPIHTKSNELVQGINDQIFIMLDNYPEIEFIDLFDLFYDYEAEEIIHSLDGVHPADSGYKLMGEHLKEAI